MIGSNKLHGIISEKTEGSHRLYEIAKKAIPGGISANIKYFSPHPIFIEKANGSYLIDVDGNKYIDYLQCYGALILGHGHPEVIKAVTDQVVSTGTFVFGTPHKLEAELANKLIEYFNGIEMVRYTNSGLEATLLTIRLAQAYSGKTMIAKFEGHYHGSYNDVLVSVNPRIDLAGDEKEPIALSDSKGISSECIENTLILPFNDIEATERLLTKYKDKLAAVILEPVQAGFIEAEEQFIKGLRALTEQYQIILIFDEVKTGFRVALGGAQSVYDVKPDLTALGKVLGGGFPIGAVGGKKEIMELMNPLNGSDIFSSEGRKEVQEEVLFHSGTYNGHPTILTAGLATIQQLEAPNVLNDLFMQTRELRNALEQLYHSYHIPMQTLGLGSIFNIILTNEPIRNYRDLQKANTELRKLLDYELLKLGIYTKPLNRYSVSTVHSEADIMFTVDMHERAIKLLKGK